MTMLICCACPDYGGDAQTCGENQGEHACKPCPCECHTAKEVEIVSTEELRRLREEASRLRAGLEMLAQVRAVCGSAQGHMRSQLRFIDAILDGADLRDVETVEAIAEGRWKKGGAS